MSLLLAAFTLLGVSGLAPVLWRRGAFLAAGGCVTACLLGLIPVLEVLWAPEVLSLRLDWGLPFGGLSVALDPLSAFFLLPLFLLAPLASFYGYAYSTAHGDERQRGWFFWNALVASMALVVVARHAVLFTVAWELMSLSSFFLVVSEHGREESRRAGWIYLAATQLGTACLLALFFVLGDPVRSFDFSDFGRAAGLLSPAAAATVFGLALAGFGTKAGFVPLHVWLPEAHPAAPSHVSALMSGVMIKMGIYGLVRTLSFFESPPLSWAMALIGIGALSGVLGVLFAVAQHDIKRLLAYHSVENIGIIALGLGVGLLGGALGLPSVAALGFAGGLLHVLNHAVFKGLLFLGAGAVALRSGTREMDRLGGLLKRMPATGACFLVGAAAITGLPPLNGFVSEFLILLSAFDGVRQGGAPVVVGAAAAVAALALIGGLAAACFTKVFGIVFLGEPRSAAAEGAAEAPILMTAPMLVLAGCCGGIALASPLVPRLFAGILPLLARRAGAAGEAALLGSLPALQGFLSIAAVLILLAAFFFWLRRRLLAQRSPTTVVTWDCGYVEPAASMQYTSSSFAQPLVDLFRPLLWTYKDLKPPQGLFPIESSVATHTEDVFRRFGFDPLFAAVRHGLRALHFLQHGRLHLYVLYIALTLLVLFAVKLR